MGYRAVGQGSDGANWVRWVVSDGKKKPHRDNKGLEKRRDTALYANNPEVGHG
jgi:hypothetical protein